MNKKPLMLMILDGWGLNKHKEQLNAIAAAEPLNLTKLMQEYPNSELEASGEAVGLPDGQMGNSEVGHLNIGAGRVVYQPLVEITRDVRTGDFFKKEVLVEAFEKAKKNDVAIHFAGLVSDGGVHSHITHLYGLLQMAKNYGLTKVYIHVFLDGRDTAPRSGLGFVKELECKIKEIGVGKIATVSGRYYSMDRDKNWTRTEKAYIALVDGVGERADSVAEAIEKSYSLDKTDEFVEPTVILEEGLVRKNDVFINFNYRPDRARQITRALNDAEFKGFKREDLNISYYCMRQYDETIDAPFIYVDKELVNTLGEVLSSNGKTQLRTAETEKYAHVTFFFNGGKEVAYKGEERVLINSPKVATYDLQPEMSAGELTEKTLAAIESEKYDVIIMNYANPDMVGHTGIMDAAVKAIKVVDSCLIKVVEKMLEKNGTVLITADHGNAELMEDPETHVPFTAHTTNRVPFILVSKERKIERLKDGKLADIAPTMLEILNLEKPKEMNGVSLIKK
ncbi:MAG: 2,3-bisphosphoglycerate-independent phosphoglycerate mutase [Fusobacteriaceae bacterium]|nr:2,3-bisphosphoglycerate-independent phosphoglycerate mutase [Fusobacteriaceae bacterium]